MKRPPQFSLGYMLLEIFWIALALGLTRAFFSLDDEYWVLHTLLMPAAIIVWGTAIGGLVRKMRKGALFAAAVIVVFALILTFCLPAVHQ